MPPYFVALAARNSNSHNNIIELNLDGEEKENENLIDNKQKKEKKEEKGIFKFISNIKEYFTSFLQMLLKHVQNFWIIVLFASIPNPLFDLAGLTCGHFGVPFWKFFGATVLGKAFIKAHMQTVFIILVFSEDVIGTVISTVEKILPFMKGKIAKMVENEKQKFHKNSAGAAASTVGAPATSYFKILWNLFLFLMIGYFIVSIINSLAQKYVSEMQKKTNKKK